MTGWRVPQMHGTRTIPLTSVGATHPFKRYKMLLKFRQLLFEVLPDIGMARLRVYRESSHRDQEVIIFGQVHRNTPSFRTVRSIATRAKLLDVRFSLENEILMSGRLDEEPRRVQA